MQGWQVVGYDMLVRRKSLNFVEYIVNNASMNTGVPIFFLISVSDFSR